MKLILTVVGSPRVGKSQLVMRYTEGKFYDAYAPTFGAELGIAPTSNMRVLIWDTAGREKERDTVRQYFTSTDGFLVVFDITDSTSFERALALISELQKFSVPIVLVGNKADLEAQRQVRPETAQSCGLPYFEVSAKNNAHVHAPFAALTTAAVTACRLRFYVWLMRFVFTMVYR